MRAGRASTPRGWGPIHEWILQGYRAYNEGLQGRGGFNGAMGYRAYNEGLQGRGGLTVQWGIGLIMRAYKVGGGLTV